MSPTKNRRKMNTSDQKQLKDALRYAHSLLEDQASKGFYPEAALVENGGKGFAPITKALEKIEKANTDIPFLTNSLTEQFEKQITAVLMVGLRRVGCFVNSLADIIELTKRKTISVTETGNKLFYHIEGSLFCEITSEDVLIDNHNGVVKISRNFTYKYYNE